MTKRRRVNLEDILRDVRREVGTWPEWRRGETVSRAMKLESEKAIRTPAQRGRPNGPNDKPK
jgi:hypothetical protein